ncbi:MAG: hypothetical protein ABSE16_03275 [Verrucomicrobiota bacterium]
MLPATNEPGVARAQPNVEPRRDQPQQGTRGTKMGFCQGSTRRDTDDKQEQNVNRGWTQMNVDEERKNRRDKLTMAARLRRETTLWLKAITARVGLGRSEERKCSAARMDATKPIRVKNEPFYGLTPFSAFSRP